MSCFDNAGASLNGAASFNEVFVTGPSSMAANDGYNQLLDADGDGIYSVTLDFLRETWSTSTQSTGSLIRATRGRHAEWGRLCTHHGLLR